MSLDAVFDDPRRSDKKAFQVCGYKPLARCSITAATTGGCSSTAEVMLPLIIDSEGSIAASRRAG